MHHFDVLKFQNLNFSRRRPPGIHLREGVTLPTLPHPPHFGVPRLREAFIGHLNTHPPPPPVMEVLEQYMVSTDSTLETRSYVYEMLSRSYEMLSRSYEIRSCSYRMISRSYDMRSRSNEMQLYLVTTRWFLVTTRWFLVVTRWYLVATR